MQASVLSAGGSAIHPQLATEWIGLLQVAATFLGFGMTQLPMTADSIDIPKLTSATSAGWVGENEAPTLSEPGTGDKSLVLRDLQAASIISMRLINGASANIEQIVRDQLIRDFGIKLSGTALRSTGTLKTPRGLRYLIHADNLNEQTGIALDDVLEDLYLLQGAVDDAFVPGEKVYVFSERVKRGLSLLKESGIFPFKEALEAAQPSLLGKRAVITQEIPNNLGSGNDSEIYYGAPSLMWHGHGEEMAVRASDTAAVNDGGTIRSMWSERAMVIDLFGRHDFELQHDVAFACIIDSEIGAAT